MTWPRGTWAHVCAGGKGGCYNASDPWFVSSTIRFQEQCFILSSTLPPQHSACSILIVRRSYKLFPDIPTQILSASSRYLCQYPVQLIMPIWRTRSGYTYAQHTHLARGCQLSFSEKSQGNVPRVRKRNDYSLVTDCLAGWNRTVVVGGGRFILMKPDMHFQSTRK